MTIRATTVTRRDSCRRKCRNRNSRVRGGRLIACACSMSGGHSRTNAVSTMVCDESSDRRLNLLTCTRGTFRLPSFWSSFAPSTRPTISTKKLRIAQLKGVLPLLREHVLDSGGGSRLDDLVDDKATSQVAAQHANRDCADHSPESPRACLWLRRGVIRRCRRRCGRGPPRTYVQFDAINFLGPCAGFFLCVVHAVIVRPVSSIAPRPISEKS